MMRWWSQKKKHTPKGHGPAQLKAQKYQTQPEGNIMFTSALIKLNAFALYRHERATVRICLRAIVKKAHKQGQVPAVAEASIIKSSSMECAKTQQITSFFFFHTPNTPKTQSNKICRTHTYICVHTEISWRAIERGAIFGLREKDDRENIKYEGDGLTPNIYYI